MLIKIKDIVIKENRREINEKSVNNLAESIREIGLLQPIVIDQNNNLVAGRHRIEAYKLLELDSIECNIINAEILILELAEIDENLVRNELTAGQLALVTSRRKEIYEKLYPESVHGASNALNSLKNKNKDADSASLFEAIEPSSFVEDTASKTNVNKRVVSENVQIGKNIPDEILETTEANKTTLLNVAKEVAKEKKMVKEELENNVENKLDTEEINKEIERRANEKAKELLQLEKHRREEAKELKRKEKEDEIKKLKEKIEKGDIELPEGLFEVIVIDPPWMYNTNYNSSGRRVASPYPEMSQVEMLKLKIPSAENSILFLWTTHRFIWDAKELLDKWGFVYRSMIIWDKEKIGMGDLFRLQCEFILVGIKGSPMINNDHKTRDIIREPRREHSRKPDCFYSMVENITVGTRLDYFGRQQRKGWKVFGNDETKFLEQ